MPVPSDALVVRNPNHDQVDSALVVARVGDASDLVLGVSDADRLRSLGKCLADVPAQRPVCGDVRVRQVHHQLVNFGRQRVRVFFDLPSGHELLDDGIHGSRQARPGGFPDLEARALLSSHLVPLDCRRHYDNLLLVEEKLSRSRFLDGRNITAPTCQPEKRRCLPHQQALDAFGLHQLPAGSNVLRILWCNATHCSETKDSNYGKTRN
mmetsp:Transcript_4481/g.11110  ORF Transcript_4481/g.11110 Transcript_4481/m.11110 type:complete len:209 (+) Transcript_4481:694-1320(+)